MVETKGDDQAPKRITQEDHIMLAHVKKLKDICQQHKKVTEDLDKARKLLSDLQLMEEGLKQSKKDCYEELSRILGQP